MPDSKNKLGSYKVISPLGQGSMGAVYLAERDDGQFFKKVAIKFVRSDFENSDIIVKRFNGERKILASLEHPNIARLLDAGHDASSKSPYLIMEYVDGLPIDQYCKLHRLSTRERIELFLQVCEGIKYAHQKLIIHRDLKPSNILVTKEGVPKILDFGIARVLDHSELDQKLTLHSQTPFTPRYASPEQICNQHLTMSSDVFSLGVLLYELLTDMPLYASNISNYQLAQSIEKSIPEMPSQAVVNRNNQDTSFEETLVEGDEFERVVLGRDLKGDLDKVTMMALRKDPNTRYATVGDLANDLRSYLDGFPVTASNPDWFYRLNKLFHRQKPIFLLGFLTLLLVCFAILNILDRNAQLEQMARQNQQVGAFFSSLFRDLDPFQVNSDKLLASDILERAYDKIVEAFPNSPKTRTILLNDAGVIYVKLGQFDKASKLLDEAYQLSSSFEVDRKLQVMILTNLADLELQRANYSIMDRYIRIGLDLGRSKEEIAGFKMVRVAAQYNREEYQDAKKVLVPLEEASEHFSTGLRFKYLNLSGWVERGLSEFDNALALGEKQIDLIEENKSLLLSQLPQTFRFMANVHRDKGEPFKSLDYLQRSLGFSKQIVGEVHPEIAKIHLDLADTFAEVGNLDEGIKALEIAKEISLKLYGEKHPQTAVMYNSLALKYLDIGNISVARTHFHKAIEIDEAINGKYSPSLAIKVANLATTYARDADFEKSIPLQERAVEIDVRSKGDDHQITLKHKMDLAIDLIEYGKLDRGAKLAKEVHSLTQKKFGEAHLKSAWSGNTLARALKARGQLDEAWQEAESSENVYRAKMGASHYELPTFWVQMIQIAFLQKRYRTTIQYCEKSLENIDLNQGKTYFGKSFFARYMGESLLALGQHRRALEAFQLSEKSFTSKTHKAYPKVLARIKELNQKVQSL